MKNLIFLLVSFFCFANGQVKNDSIVTAQIKAIERDNTEMKLLLKTLEEKEKKADVSFKKLEKKHLYLIRENDRLKKSKSIFFVNRDSAVKTDNINEPVTDVIIPDGIDTIRKPWINRIFSKEKYLYKHYKKIGDEKFYLD